MNIQKRKNKIYADENGNDLSPWYLQPWFYFVFGIPVFTIFASIILIFIAFNNSPKILAKQTIKSRIGAILVKSAQNKGINVEVSWTSDNQIKIALTSEQKITDKSLSVVMIETKYHKKTHNNEKIFTSSNNTDKPVYFLDFELDTSTKNPHDFISSTKFSSKEINREYWMEIIGYKSSWVIHGIISPTGFELI